LRCDMSAQTDEKLFQALRKEINDQVDQIARLQKTVREQEHEIVKLNLRIKYLESRK